MNKIKNAADAVVMANTLYNKCNVRLCFSEDKTAFETIIIEYGYEQS